MEIHQGTPAMIEPNRTHKNIVSMVFIKAANLAARAAFVCVSYLEQQTLPAG
jgi:hypothetical protein